MKEKYKEVRVTATPLVPTVTVWSGVDKVSCDGPAGKSSLETLLALHSLHGLNVEPVWANRGDAGCGWWEIKE